MMNEIKMRERMGRRRRISRRSDRIKRNEE
jgi:hypothetical protein